MTQLKYIKYINSNNSNKTQNGGGAMFPQTDSYYFIANITDNEMINKFNQRTQVVGIDPTKYSSYHVTLLQFDINKNDPNRNIFYSDEFYKIVKFAYEETFIKNKSKIIYVQKKYDIMGKKQWFAKKYRVPQETLNQLHAFRMIIYKSIEIILGPSTTSQKRSTDNNIYYVYSYQGNELFAVPQYYHGTKTWEPHISFFRLEDITDYDLLQLLRNQPNVEMKKTVILNKIKKAYLAPLGDIYFDQHLRSLTVGPQKVKKTIIV